MKEILITSTILIAAISALRWIFRGRVRHSLIYAAWLLVAVRLLVPVQLGKLDFSFLSGAKPMTEALEQLAETPVTGEKPEQIRQEVELEYFVKGEELMPLIQEILEQEKLRNPEIDQQWGQLYEQITQEYPVEEIFTPGVQEEIEQTVQQRSSAPTVGQIAMGIWIAGASVMIGWFLWVNLSLAAKLRRSGRPVSVPGVKIRVMESSAASSPCLFGVFRPTVWLNPGCTENETRLHHVLTHEQCHYRQMDHIWSLVRCVCLCLYWFNPLVWVAAWLSKRDCELACDEAALKKLGDSERLAYGKTLVDLVAENVSAGQLLETATAMHETKHQLKTRVGYIVKKPKVLMTAVAVLVVLLAVVTGCSFAGPRESQPELNVPETTESTEETEATKATEPKPTETQPAPTQPTETQSRPTGLEVLPEIPKMDTLQEKPNNMTAEDFVFTVYEKQVYWENGYIKIKVPALLPISEEAVAVNNAILNELAPTLSDVRYCYEKKMNRYVEIDYSVYQLNNYVTIRVAKKNGNILEDFRYTFNCTTATVPSMMELARLHDPQLEYPQMLYAVYKLFGTGEKAESILGLLTEKSLYLDKELGVCLKNGSYSGTAKPLASLNPSQYSIDQCYQWLFDYAINGKTDAISQNYTATFLDAPKTFIQQYLSQKDADSWVVRKLWKAENDLVYAVARTIMMDRENSYLMRCGAYIMASNLLPEDEQNAFLKEVYDAYADDQHALQPNGREFFNQLVGKMTYGRDIWRKIELEYRTEVLDATWKVCFIDMVEKAGFSYQYSTDAQVILDYDIYLKKLRSYIEDPEEFGIKIDLTSEQCQESFRKVTASISEIFFEENVLIWVRHYDVKHTAPKVTKVDYDRNAFWNNPYQVHFDCVDGNEEIDMVEYQILVAIPKEQYQEFPENYEELFWHSVWENVSCVLNGDPYVKMDY